MDIVNVVIDCADPHRLAPLWRAATGYQIIRSSDEVVVLAPGANRGPNLLLRAGI
jgi:hypothetical protein